MGKRGPKPKLEPRWSSELSYAIGLLVTDGCLSKDGRHISLVSKDLEQLNNFKKALGLEYVAIGHTNSGYNGKPCTRIQFGNITLYRFLLRIGLTPNKSKTVGAIKVPPEYFFDFLRGSFDGDGCTYSYWDPRWKSSFMFYTTFVSASEPHVAWLREEVSSRLGVRGHITRGKDSSLYQLRYAKADSMKVLRAMYHQKNIIHLSRKRLKIERMLGIIGERL